VNGSPEGFADARFGDDFDYLPPFASTLNNGALLRNGLVTVHVEVDLFSGRVTVIPKHYLLGRLHVPHLCQLDANSSLSGAFETTVIPHSRCSCYHSKQEGDPLEPPRKTQMVPWFRCLRAGFLCSGFGLVMDRAANLRENFWRHVLHVVRCLSVVVGFL